jgi:hypothetical protein
VRFCTAPSLISGFSAYPQDMSRAIFKSAPPAVSSIEPNGAVLRGASERPRPPSLAFDLHNRLLAERIDGLPASTAAR